MSFHPAGLLGDFILTILSPPLWTHKNPEGSPNRHKTRASSLQLTLVLTQQIRTQALQSLKKDIFKPDLSWAQGLSQDKEPRTEVQAGCVVPAGCSAVRIPEALLLWSRTPNTTHFQLSIICFLPLALPALLFKPFASLLFPIPKEHRPLENTSGKILGRKCQPTPAFLPGKSHGQRSLARYSPWGHKQSDMTWQLNSNKIDKYRNRLVKFLLHSFEESSTNSYILLGKS